MFHFERVVNSRMIAGQILSAFERIFPELLSQPTSFPLAA